MAKGNCIAVFRLQIPKDGRYELRISYPASANRARNVPIEIIHATGTASVMVDQTRQPELDRLFQSVGVYDFTAGQAASVTISNQETQGHVVIDAVQLLPVE